MDVKLQLTNELTKSFTYSPGHPHKALGQTTIFACNQLQGQLSLLPSVGWEMSNSQSAVMLYDCGVKAGMGVIPR